MTDHLLPLRRVLYDFDLREVEKTLMSVAQETAPMRLCHPFETMAGPQGYVSQALAPLATAIPDLERRETIAISGDDADGQTWLGICGYYTGRFAAPFLGILPTGQQVSMRFHEFFRLEDGKISEMQALWDLPELMLQAGLWPMPPALGREWHVPGPATQDGLGLHGDGAEAQRIVTEMLEALGNYATGGAEAMRLADYWHPRCSWYGPSGIGTARGIDGFRTRHQIPFLKAMPNRVGDPHGGHLFAAGNYVGFTAWPGMQAKITGDGWMGIAPAGQEITMRSLDFWRVEAGMIRENWVLVDLLDIYNQLGVDVLARMSEMAAPRLL